MFSEAIGYVDYDAPGEVISTHPAWTNLMTTIPRLSQEENAYKVKRGKSGFKLLMSSELKNTARIKEVVQQLTKPGGLVVDACGETFAVAEASILLLADRRFIGCEVDRDSVTNEMLKLILLYARQVLRIESDIDGEE